MFWLPIIGPVLQGLFSSVTSIFNKKEDTKITEINAATQIIHDTSDDIGVRFNRDLLLFFPCLWTALIGWDTIMAKRFPEFMWHVADYPPTLAYLPIMAATFLLGNIGLNAWKNR